MSILASTVRKFSLTTLSSIKEKPKYPFSKWLESQEFHTYAPIASTKKFTLNISNESNFLNSLLFDLDRMLVGAFESMYCITQVSSSSVSKSRAWLVIQAYYSAYFAAHAILRFLGDSCSWIYQNQIYKIQEINEISHTKVQLVKGYYHCQYDCNTKELKFISLNSSGGGSHESFWKIFLSKLRDLSTKILQDKNPAFPAVTTQQVISKIKDLENILCHENHLNGAWLSFIRKQVNYRHEYNVWFPYRYVRKRDVTGIYQRKNDWCKDPMEISLITKAGIKLDTFYSACHFIVGMCRVILEDLLYRRSSLISSKMESLKLLRNIEKEI